MAALADDNLHLILTLPADSPHRDLLAFALKPDCITVHLGEADDGNDYDFVVNPAVRSVNDVTKFLHTIMENDDMSTHELE